jgi:leucyl aminopeptidase (aminopeptidase T)
LTAAAICRPLLVARLGGVRRTDMGWPDKERIRRGVAAMLEVNLAVQEGEKVLVMTDPPSLGQWGDLGLEWLEEALERCVLAREVADLASELLPRSDVTFLPYAAVEHSGAEPDPQTAERMKASDVIIAINTYSLSHTMAAQEACEAGARVASMPGFLAEMFEGAMTADHDRMARDSKKMADLLTAAKVAVVRTPLGTELTLSLEGRQGDVDAGLIRSSTATRPTPLSSLGNLPGGEAFIAPVEGKAEGKVVVSAEGYARLDEPMTLFFSEGLVSEIRGGGAVGEDFRQLLDLPTPGVQPARRNLAELGVGTNPEARSVESELEAEKIMGTVHIAIGDNAHIGGVVHADLHEDFILWQPDLLLDGKAVIRAGKWQV